MQRRGDAARPARGAREGGADGRGQRPHARGAAALLRGDDARVRRAGAHLGGRLRHGARAQALALRGRGARPAAPRPVSRRTAPLEALAATRPARNRAPGRAEIPEDELLRLSYRQIDDYETCPLKYRYLHVLRVPLSPTTPWSTATRCTRRCAATSRRAWPAASRTRTRWSPPSERPGSPRAALARARGGAAVARARAMLRRFHAEEANEPWAPGRRRGGVRLPAGAQPRSRAATTSSSRRRRRGRRSWTSRPATCATPKAAGAARAREPAARHLRARAPEDQGAAAGPRRAALPGDRPRGWARAVPHRRRGPSDRGPDRRERGARHPQARVSGSPDVLRVQPVPVP